jgi:hypothetical protein
MNVFLRLLDSRKFIVVVLGMGGACGLAFTGKIDGAAVADILKWAISAYAIGTGLEGIGKGGGTPGAVQ